MCKINTGFTLDSTSTSPKAERPLANRSVIPAGNGLCVCGGPEEVWSAFVFERICKKHDTCLNFIPVGTEHALYSALCCQAFTSQLPLVLEGVEPFRRFHLVPRALAKIAKHLARVSDSCTDCAASWRFRFHPTLALIQWISTNNLVNIWRTIHCIVRHCVDKTQRVPL